MEIQTVQEPSDKKKGEEEKASEMPIHRQGFQLLKMPVWRDMVLPGSQAMGTPIAVTIL